MLYRSPFGAPHQSLRREIDRLFEDALGRGDSGRSWIPSVDIRETEKAITLAFELPGIRAENVEVTSESGVLTVRGEKREERTEDDEQEGRYHIVERSYGAFTRSFQLPPGIDEDNIDASFDNGVLTVRVPKSDTPQSRRIEIAGGRQAIAGGSQVGTGSQGGRQPGERDRGTERAPEGGRSRVEPRAASGAGGREETRAASGRGSPGARGEPRGDEGKREPASARSAPGKGSKNR
jgi:HSP20 family protein